MATATESKTFHAALVTPEAQLLDCEVTAVQIPAHDGLLGLLNHRAPLLTKLGVGILTLESPGSAPQRFLIAGGYAQMKDNVLTILTDEATPAAAVTVALRDAEARKLASLIGTDEASLNSRQKSQARLASIDRLLQVS